MIKKAAAFLTVFILFLCPFDLEAQTANYFPNRLIIKYESDQKLSQLRAKQKMAPSKAVEQFLYQAGAMSLQPLFKGPLRQQLRKRNIAAANKLLGVKEVVFNQPVNVKMLAAKVSSMPGVAYAEPRYIQYMSLVPNDPVSGPYINYHNFAEAWNLSTGSSDVVIAIVDGGVGYTHDELDDKLWVNQDEVPVSVFTAADQDGNGTLTSTEIKQYLQTNGSDYNGDGQILLDDALHPDAAFTDGIDNDINSFVDDLFGWDFWASGSFNGTVIQDNNPIHDGSDHGTHVAGIAAAETNNSRGLAGAGYNSSYMAIKAGGIPDDPTTPDRDESRAIGFGYEGIIYAAEQGADIINCSWGGGGFSQLAQDVINYATSLGSLVIAAAGNSGVNQVDYPAGYDKVLAVGSVETSDLISIYSNYGYKVDVFATGSSIESAGFNNEIVSKSGTSMATPVVSGLAGLVKAIHPNWGPERIGYQIRNSSTFIVNENPELKSSRLGHGKIDAFEALNTNKPALKITAFGFEDTESQKLGIEEEGSLFVTVTNLGSATSSLNLQVQSLNKGGIVWNNQSQQVGVIANGETVEVSFGLTITDAFDLNQTPTFRLNFEDVSQSYRDFDVLQYERFLFDVVAVNDVKTSFAADGTVGFTKPLSQMGGAGFIPRGLNGDFEPEDNLLFEGGLMVEYEKRLFDAVRTQGGAVSRDFNPQDVFAVAVPGEVSAADGHTVFTTGNDTLANAVIELNTYAYDGPGLENVIFLKYTISNPSSFNLIKNLYIGLFNDWDIADASANSVSFIESDSLMYISGPPNSDTPVAAVAHLSPVSGALAISNPAPSRDSLTFGIYDGFTDSEKKAVLKSGTVKTSVQDTDVSTVVASGPYTLEPQSEVVIGFVYAFGEDIGELRNQIAEARAQVPFEVSSTGRAVSTKMPSQTALFQNYPNPFTGSTQIRLDLEESTHVTLTVFDVLGRKVRTIVNSDLPARSHYFEFAGSNLSSGVYFLRLKTEDGVQTVPMTLIK